MTGGTAPGPGPAASPEPPPGLAAERTRLAWRRTTLSGVVLVLIATSLALEGGLTRVKLVAVALMALLWLGTIGVAHRRITRLSRGFDAPPFPPGRAPAHLALLVVGLGLVGVALAVTTAHR